ncbi:hypothetical protein ABEB36_003450 [Hypothenemus hampei]|uniref:VPS37 C-terminal domain-containing protein n=1 Tax=Hypothenemus hampei TaxID=57062 RepID=A0ABD1F982_HYPHA
MLQRFLKPDVNNRKQQISTLKIFNDNVTEINEDCEYEVAFQSGNNNLVLGVTLSNDFPEEKPVLSIKPLISHPWANENGLIVAAPGLLNFTPHSDLGRVVQAIIREFQRIPPNLVSDANTVSPSVPITEKRTSPNFSNYNFSPPHCGPSVSGANSMIMQPIQSSIFPELNLLSTEELRFLNESENRQDEFIDELPNVREHNRMLDELIAQIEETAEENLSKEEKVCHLRDVVESQIEEVTKLAFDNERLYSQYQNLSENYSPRNIQDAVGKAAKAAEEDSERIAESFLQGELDVDKFLVMFIKAKSLYQLRKTKEEKLCQQLNRLEKAGF